MSSFEDYYYKNIAEQIRKYRLKNGLTQEELSDMLSKNLKYIGVKYIFYFYMQIRSRK